MVGFLINNWKYIGVVAATLFVTFLLHSIKIGWLEQSHAQALKDLEVKLNAECMADQNITREVSDEYQKQIANLNRRLRDLDRVPKYCVPVSSGTGGRDGPAEAGKHGGSHGVTSQALYAYAGDAEQYRLQLIACQSFIRKAAK